MNVASANLPPPRRRLPPATPNTNSGGEKKYETLFYILLPVQSLADAELGKDAAQHLLRVDGPSHTPQGARRPPHLLACNVEPLLLLLPVLRCRRRLLVPQQGGDRL